MAIRVTQQPQRAAFDTRGAQDLRRDLQGGGAEATQAVARQFETMFLQMVMKSMRDTVPQDGLLNSDQSRFYTGLFDQQLAQNLSTSGGGLGFARLIEQQLGRQLAAEDGAANLTASLAAGARAAQPLPPVPPAGTWPASAGTTATSSAAPVASRSLPATDGTPQGFVAEVWPHAVEASRSTGIPPQFLVAHAALESGWGRNQPHRADGLPSFNLFGIKAGGQWSGATTEAATTEYVNGLPVRQVERFRAYGSYTEAFRDYANLLRNNPRYGGVIGAQDGTEFAKRLQQAGYATDPRYAEKLAGIINGPTLRQALIG